MKKIKRVLYLDDQPDQLTAEDMRDEFGKDTVFVALNIEKAIELHKESPFDLIISDGNLLAGTTGLDFYHKIKDSFNGTFILYSGDSHLTKEAGELGLKTISKGGSYKTLLNYLKKLNVDE